MTRLSIKVVGELLYISFTQIALKLTLRSAPQQNQWLGRAGHIFCRGAPSRTYYWLHSTPYQQFSWWPPQNVASGWNTWQGPNQRSRPLAMCSHPPERQHILHKFVHDLQIWVGHTHFITISIIRVFIVLTHKGSKIPLKNADGLNSAFLRAWKSNI